MTDAAAAASAGRVGSPLAGGWGVALGRGLLALCAVGLVAEGVALAAWAVGRTGLSLLTALRVGGLYLEAFHRVPLRLSGAGLDVSELTAGQASIGAVRAEVAVAPLAATALALWLLWRGGRAVADAAGGTAIVRALHGAKVAPVYAVGTLVVALICRLRAPIPSWSIVRGGLELSAAPVWAFLLPFGLGVVAGAGGGWYSTASARSATRSDPTSVPTEPRPRFARSAVSGGAWMLLVGLALSYAGLFLAGVVRPDGPEALLTPSTARYARAVFDRPSRGLLVLVHHVAVAPNEAVWALVPAMGGCTGAYPDSGSPERFLCYRRFPREVALPAQLSTPSGTAGPAAETRFGPAPAPYWLFLLAPAVATLLGGRFAVRRYGDPMSASRRIGLGASAGVVFTVLLVGVAWLASVSASGSVRLGNALDVSGGMRIGPGLVGATALGLAWGVVGGGIGAVATARAS